MVENCYSNIISNKLENTCLSESLVVERVRLENGLIKIEKDERGSNLDFSWIVSRI